jgi:hypothetical protein
MTHRTNPALWERIVHQVKSEQVAGTLAGEWSARKAQVAVKRYKEAGGRYIGQKSESNSLVKWDEQHWTTKSGQPSHVTGERYLPQKAIEHLSASEYAQTTAAKRRGMAEGKQFVPQPASIRRETKRYRQN